MLYFVTTFFYQRLLIFIGNADSPREGETEKDHPSADSLPKAAAIARA